MITPAYALTATERVLPRMALDFTTGVLDSRVTVARLLNTATRVNSSGFIEIVNANLPRFDYDPVTLAPKGLLIEEARTNLIRHSIDFTNILWLKLNASVTANATTSPDGTNNATKMVESATSGVHAMYQDFLVVSGTAYTASIFVKAAERTWCVVELGGPPLACSVYVNLATGATGTQSGSPSSVVVTPFKDGWWRIQISKTASATPGSGNLAVYPATGNGGVSYAGNGTSGIFVYGGDSEAGAFATSYIPTTTIAVLRNSDVVNMTGTNFSSWYNSSEGTFSATFQTIVTGSVPTSTFIAAFDNNASKRIMYIGSGSFDVSSFDGVSVLPAGIDATGSVITCLSAYSASGRAIAATGLNPVTGTVAAGYSTATLLNIGNAGGVTLLNGWFSKLRFWPQRLTARELSAFSK